MIPTHSQCRTLYGGCRSKHPGSATDIDLTIHSPRVYLAVVRHGCDKSGLYRADIVQVSVAGIDFRLEYCHLHPPMIK